MLDDPGAYVRPVLGLFFGEFAIDCPFDLASLLEKLLEGNRAVGIIALTTMI